MSKNIVIIDGHPDADPTRFCHALAQAYADGAAAAEHSVKRLAIAELGIPPLTSRAEWEQPAGGVIKDCQNMIAGANHLVIIYPLWLGAMPAALKAFLEQVFRPGFAINTGKRTMWPGRLQGKSARVIVTMGMPGWLYRWYFGAYTLKSLERNILRFSGIAPVHSTILGNVEGHTAAKRQQWLNDAAALGRRAA